MRTMLISLTAEGATTSLFSDDHLLIATNLLIVLVTLFAMHNDRKDERNFLLRALDILTKSSKTTPVKHRRGDENKNNNQKGV